MFRPAARADRTPLARHSPICPGMTKLPNYDLAETHRSLLLPSNYPEVADSRKVQTCRLDLRITSRALFSSLVLLSSATPWSGCQAFKSAR